ncbi:dolichyl-phosphate-mannose--protein mannosyltransferase [Microbacterium sp. GXS0129]|uniref:dolichyl-phosphate-mannose--protein mannosyltransferase n=1 Tax=Microbacterium sp. GXS0129 TaxID=3377836 RepID=UPI00383BDDA3
MTEPRDRDELLPAAAESTAPAPVGTDPGATDVASATGATTLLAADERPADTARERPDYVGPGIREAWARWWARRAATPVLRDIPDHWRGAVEWVVPGLLMLVAALIRFTGLDHPHQLVFDETYYVKDAWSLSHLGYEANWPEGANEKFAAGDTDIFETSGARVVHPPLGKWLIAAGMWIFGGASSFGWRFSTALFGVLTVLVVYLIMRRMTRSIAWAAIAAGFVAIDGIAIVMSRVALLDGILTFFVLLGVYFVLLDHRPTMARIARSADSFTGPTMWNRPWLIAAGIAFGAAGAVKWSGFYALAGFGIYLVAADAFARRRAGIKMWGSAAIGRQAPATFVLLVPVAFVVYLLSWTGWLVTSGGYMRDSDSNPFVALYKYHMDSFSFHVGLSTPHSYMSPAWQWPFLVRPTSMFWDSTSCDPDKTNACAEAITSIPNPALWWIGAIATLVLLYGLVRFRDWRYAIVLVGFATSYLPWLAVPERTIFQFYTVIMEPFMMMAIALVLQRLSESGPPDERRAWRIVTGVIIAVAVALSVFFLPLWTGMATSRDYWQLHMWLPTWI